jgi:putative oxidoreductase
LFLLYGTEKLFGFPAAADSDGSTVPLVSQLGVAGVLEAMGGVLLFVGLFTRPVAFILSGMMAIAYFQVHFPGGFWPTTNGGVPSVLYCFIWLFFAAAGAGPWSLDALRRSHRG